MLRVIAATLSSIADQMDGGIIVATPPKQVRTKRPAPTKVRSTRTA